MHLNISLAKWRLFFIVLGVLTDRADKFVSPSIYFAKQDQFAHRRNMAVWYFYRMLLIFKLSADILAYNDTDLC